MAKRDNDLFIGKEYLNIEGREIKHPSLIDHYATPSISKISEDPINLMGIDIETDKDTGEMKLLGVYEPKRGYEHFTPKSQELFAKILFSMIKYCKSEGTHIAYWNRLDPFQFFKTLLLNMSDPEAQKLALGRFAKEGGEWSKKKGWVVPPILKLEMDGYEFGIKQAIRSSIQFFYRPLRNYEGAEESDEEIYTVWAYDVKSFYQGRLEKEASSRFKWYSKVDKSAHEIDWTRFRKDKDYRKNIVLYSNMLDAKAAYHLGMTVQENFKRAFNYYPTSLVSSGGIARSAIVAVTLNRIGHEYPDKKERMKALREEISSIGFINHYDEWVDRYDGDFVKNLYSMAVESYSGGLIDAIRYGKTDWAWYADIASAYPGIIQTLKDLRGATITYGKGKPVHAKNGYTFVRGMVHIPRDVKYHSITVKHPLFKETNIRANGHYRASYLIEERDFLIEQGATFKDEEYFVIETKGKLSVIAKAVKELVEIRAQLKKKGDSAEQAAKTAANSVYGITYEAVPVYEVVKRVYTETEVHRETFYKDLLKPYLKNIDLTPYMRELKHLLDPKSYQSLRQRWHSKDGYSPDIAREELETEGVVIDYDHPVDILMEMDTLYRMDPKEYENFQYEKETIERKGFRGGEFWNPLYASIITGLVRLQMARAANAVEANGGRVIIMMTDSLTWEGSKTMLPSDMVRKKKTLGYFEEPEKVKDMICLGSGRYGFYMQDDKGQYTEYEAKRRGLNASEIHDPNGVVLDFNWHRMLKQMREQQSDMVKVKVRTLISPGLVYHSAGKYTVKDLGRIVEQTRKVKAIVGTTKRDVNPDVTDPETLSKGLVDTEPIYLTPHMFGSNATIDQTLVSLREKMMEKECKTQKGKQKDRWKKSSKNAYKKKKETIKANKRFNYQLARSAGMTVEEAKKVMSWSTDRLFHHLTKKEA